MLSTTIADTNTSDILCAGGAIQTADGSYLKHCKHHNICKHREESNGKRQNRVLKCALCKRERQVKLKRNKEASLASLICWWDSSLDPYNFLCYDCNKKKDIGELEFHHINPATKLFSIRDSALCFEKLKQEALKCVLLCHMCHVEHHKKLRKLERETS